VLFFRSYIERTEQVTSLRNSNHIWGITSAQVEKAENIQRESVGAEPLPKKRRTTQAAAIVAVGTSRTELLEGKFSRSQMAQFIAHLRDRGLRHLDDDRDRLIKPAARAVISNMMFAKGFVGELDIEEWFEWEGVELAEKLSKCFENPDAAIARSCVDWQNLMLREAKLSLDVRKTETFLSYIQSIFTVKHEAVTKETSESGVVEHLLSHIVKGSNVTLANRTLHQRLSRVKSNLTSLTLFTNEISRLCNAARSSVEEADQWEERPAAKGTSDNGKDQRSKGESSHNSGDNNAKSKRFTCNGCGNREAKQAGNSCIKCVGHPDRNTSGQWQDSESFKAIRARLPNAPFPYLPSNHRANGDPLSTAERTRRDELRDAFKEKSASGKQPRTSPNPSGKYQKNNRVATGKYLNTLLRNNQSLPLVPCNVLTNDGASFAVQALVDTGALDENFVSPRVVKWWAEKNQVSKDSCKIPADLANSLSRIIMGGTNIVEISTGMVAMHISFLNQITNSVEIMPCLRFRKLETAFDIILGLPTIQQFDLTKKLRSFFVSERLWSSIGDEGNGRVLDFDFSSKETSDSKNFDIHPQRLISFYKNQYSEPPKLLSVESSENEPLECDRLEVSTWPFCSGSEHGFKNKFRNKNQNPETVSFGNLLNQNSFGRTNTGNFLSDNSERTTVGKILDDSSGRIIVGFNATSNNPSNNLKQSLATKDGNTVTPVPVPFTTIAKSCSCRQPSSSHESLSRVCGLCKEEGMGQLQPWWYLRQKPNPSANLQLCTISSVGIEPSAGIEFPIFDTDEIYWKDDPFDVDIHNKSTPSALLGQINVFGSDELQTNIKKLCFEFQDIFSEAVISEPARVPPMEIAVDKSKWNTNKNRGPPRPQSDIRQAVIKKQVNKYLELGVIQPSKASEYSQVHLVPKHEPNDWRFCLDYVRLNEATIGVEGWPIPNIPQMIQRIGSKRPKFFGVMDMTSGYHQAPMAPMSRVLTAFICFMGVFEWLRVPMGAKNAGPYFQRVMATVVLVGLLYVICELYIDDCITYGETEEEFITNLRQVFQRFREYNISINPKKCRLGLDKIEFVSHVISRDGITFSDEKRKKVVDFPLPSTGKKLLGFLGLVNYFRDHLPDMTGKLKDLRKLFRSLKGPVEWTPELEQHFYTVRDTVANCPALFFPISDGEVVVMTDASDFGIGAYIFQRVDGQERPIIFLSKALHGAQLNWSTIEKEAYAIFYTLKTHDHLLRDIPFTLKTDHKNLTYINLESSQKVRRWKLFLQDFNFKMEHVAGVDNPVADAFSRLCVNINEVPEYSRDIVLATLQTVKERDFKIPTAEYHKIGQVHNSRVGHLGVEATLDLLRANKDIWKHMRLHVKHFIKQCPICQANSDTKILTNIPPFTRASYEPMEVLNIDTIGPLPEDEHKNKFILVIIDCFSRWVELFGIPDTSGLSAARAILQHCGRFGIPALLRSDRGSQFVNEVIEHLVELLDSTHEVTTAYSKEENAVVERANKEVMRHLRAIVFEDRVYHSWSSDQLPLVMRILNSQQKARTGVSPAEILFGNAVDLGRYILHRPSGSLFFWQGFARTPGSHVRQTTRFH
jgi:hypothetical protein